MHGSGFEESKSPKNNVVYGSGFETVPKPKAEKVIVGAGFEKPSLPTTKMRAVVTSRVEQGATNVHYLWILDKTVDGCFVSKSAYKIGHFFEGLFTENKNGQLKCQNYESGIETPIIPGGMDEENKIWFQVKIKNYRKSVNQVYATVQAEYFGEITLFRPIIESSQLNKSSVKTEKIIYIPPDEKVVEKMKQIDKFSGNLWTLDSTQPSAMRRKSASLAEFFVTQCRKVLQHREILETLRAENFDLAITEPVDGCAYALFEYLQIRAHITVLSCVRFDHVSDVISQPIVPSYVPSTQSFSSDQMSMFERFWNLVTFYYGRFTFANILDQEFELARQILGIERSWREVLPEASFILSNQIPILDFPAPTFDKIVPIGGFTVKKSEKSLKFDEKWDKILSLRRKNVLISFGSNAKSVDMPEEYRTSLLHVIQSMPDTTFIWKYEDPEPKFDLPENVFLSPWLPQNELLADKRITVFLTHGGLASVMELALTGKPSVMVPIFADQGRNAQMVKRHGSVFVLQKHELGKSELVKSALNSVLNDPKFQKNAEKLAEMLKMSPINAKETLVKHVEFAAKFGKLPTMDNYGRHQSFVVYYFLDIISVFVISVGLLIVLIVKMFKVLGWKSKKCKEE
uniref:glucuronosyltransferase n=1 Tax=Caenorhabditis japonica TaxID=281687 RepID=A0A8R1I7K0_CAEJA